MPSHPVFLPFFIWFSALHGLCPLCYGTWLHGPPVVIYGFHLPGRFFFFMAFIRRVLAVLSPLQAFRLFFLFRFWFLLSFASLHCGWLFSFSALCFVVVIWCRVGFACISRAFVWPLSGLCLGGFLTVCRSFPPCQFLWYIRSWALFSLHTFVFICLGCQDMLIYSL